MAHLALDDAIVAKANTAVGRPSADFGGGYVHLAHGIEGQGGAIHLPAERIAMLKDRKPLI